MAYDLGVFYRDLGEVMGMSVPELSVAAENAHRIARLQARK